MKYFSTAETAEKWGISQRRVSLLCSQGRVYGALKTGNTWIIPQYSVKPSDERASDCYCVEEPSCSYISTAKLSIDPELLKQASVVFASRGESVSDAINMFLFDSVNSGNKRTGIAKGLFEAPEDIDFCNEEVAKLFGV